MAKNLIVGAGLSGLTLARLLAEGGDKVYLIDERSHVGGNVFDYNDDGILVHKYGSHIFHTNNEKVWKFLNRFAIFSPYMHKVKALVNGELVPVPFNINSLYKAFPNKIAQYCENRLLDKFKFGTKISILDLKKEFGELADFIYEHIFVHYTAKQWQCKPEELDKSVFERVPVSISNDDRYFQDRFQGIPFEGYAKLCERIADHPNITMALGVKFEYGMEKSYNRLFYSGAIDEFFGYKFGELPYRSLDFKLLKLNCPQFQECAVVNYPNNYDYTRISEFKHYLPFKSSKTIIAYEYSKNWRKGDERYYPVPNDSTSLLYRKYENEASKCKNLYFIGRLGKYKYFNMDEVVAQSMELAETLLMQKSGLFLSN